MPHDRFGRFAQLFRGCRVPGCAAQHYGKGFCRGHLSAFERGRIDADGISVRGCDVRVTGPELRRFRRDQNWNQERLADLLGISKSYLQALESSRGPIPDRIADRLKTLQRALAAGDIKSDTDKPRLRFYDFHRSLNFSKKPPFASLPACLCGDARCRLSPVKDREWDGQHLWKFRGTRCVRIRYVNAQGKIVATPRELKRPPLLQKRCSKCGRLRQIDRRYRARLGGYVLTLRCAPQTGECDPPERFIERNGKVRGLTTEDEDKLRDRSKTEFEKPKCQEAACPRKGERMERTANLSRLDEQGRIWRFALYRCRPARPANSHSEYRVLPHGEVARPVIDEKTRKVIEGRYRWTDAQTGEQHGTIRKPRAVRKDRVMPAGSVCQRCGGALSQSKGPFRDAKGKYWIAVCEECGERRHVYSNASTSALAKGGRRKKGKSGPKGPSGPRKLTVLRNAIAAISELRQQRQKEVADDLFPNEREPLKQLNKTYDYFSHYRTEIDTVKQSLSTRSQSELNPMYDRDRRDLVKLLRESNPQKITP